MAGWGAQTGKWALRGSCSGRGCPRPPSPGCWLSTHVPHPFATPSLSFKMVAPRRRVLERVLEKNILSATTATRESRGLGVLYFDSRFLERMMGSTYRRDSEPCSLHMDLFYLR